MKKLYRSNTSKILAGVCGGIADYFHISPKIVRLIFIIGLFIPFFPSLFIYACMWTVVEPDPVKPFDKKSKTNVIDVEVVEKPVEKIED